MASEICAKIASIFDPDLAEDSINSIPFFLEMLNPSS